MGEWPQPASLSGYDIPIDLQSWFADFEIALINADFLIMERLPQPGRGLPGFVYTLGDRLNKHNLCGCWMPDYLSSTSTAFETAQTVAQRIRGEHTNR
jgi:hypothetical protein